MPPAEPIPIEGPTVFFTGAGISVGAGLPTYRGTGGIYEDSDLQPPHARDLVPDRLPGLWARFGDRLRAAGSIAPSAAHRRIGELEGLHPAPITVVTQNVDGLHARAGSSRVIELHGTLLTMRCLGAGHRVAVEDATWVDGLPICATCGEPCRPDVVLFGEALPQDVWEAAETAIGQARTIVAVGTSAQVYPAALLIQSRAGLAQRRIWVNPEAEPPDAGWTWLQGGADEQVARLVPA